MSRSAVLCYFWTQDSEGGSYFKALFPYEPYFFIWVKEEHVKDVVAQLNQKYENLISGIDYMDKVDLDQPNHLSGQMAKFLKLNFKTVENLMDVRNDLWDVINRERERISTKQEDQDYFLEKK